MTHDRDIRELLDLYIDGGLSIDERERFERAIENNESVRAELELQEQINASLVRMVEPTSVHMPRKRSRVKFAAAALLLLTLSAAVLVLNWRAVFPGQEMYAGPDGEYRRQVEQGFTPRVVCTSEEEFGAYVADRFGTPVLARAADNVELLGWDYTTGVRGYQSVVLLVRVDDEPVVVLMDPIERDIRLSLARAGDLTIHRRNVGGVTMHEVTPLGDASVLDLFYVPEN